MSLLFATPLGAARCPRCGVAVTGRFCAACGVRLDDRSGQDTIDLGAEPTAEGPPSTGGDPAGDGGALAPSLASIPAAAAVRDDDHLVGRRLGPCELRRRLGAGGMGVVYEAWHENLHKAVAVKVLPEATSRDEALLERFRREARAAARVDHPGIVRVYDLGEDAGRAFIIQELVDGVTLAKTLAQEPSPLPLARGLRVARDLAVALAAAHDAGLVHRDIKPANVMLTRKGEVKVLDFGLAKLANSAEGAADGVQVSLSGQVLGTPHYMSPEQCKGVRGIDHRTDLYSFGALLFELATGSRPFEADTITGLLLHQIMTAPPDPRAFASDVPDALAELIRALLAKDPADRPESASEVAAALDRLLAALPADAAERPRRRARGSGSSASTGSDSGRTAAGSQSGSSSGRRLARGAYRNPLSRALGHAATLTALFLVACPALGMYAAFQPDVLLYVALIGPLTVAMVVALFSPRPLSVLAAALLPLPLIVGAFVGLLEARGIAYHDDEYLALALGGPLVLLVASALVHALARSSSGPTPLPAAVAVVLAFGPAAIFAALEETPFDHERYHVLVHDAKALEAGDRDAALALYERAARLQDRVYLYSWQDDARLRAVRLYLAEPRLPGADAEAERHLRALLEHRLSWNLGREHREVGVRFFAERGDFETALRFIPEGPAEHFGVGMELDDARLADLYAVAWELARGQGALVWAQRIAERGAGASAAFRGLGGRVVLGDGRRLERLEAEEGDRARDDRGAGSASEPWGGRPRPGPYRLDGSYDDR